MAEPVRWLLLGAGAPALVALGARWRRALSGGGALAAVGVGAAVVGGGGWWWGLLIVAFFLSSSALGRGRRGATAAAAGPPVVAAARGSERDAVQVLANGGVAALLAVAAAVWPEGAAIAYGGFAGALAAATADTWATEIGARSRSAPRSIVDRRPVPVGTSGGVTPLGSAASIGGAAFLAALAGVGVAAGAAPSDAGPWVVLVAVALAGVAGSLIDSVLGATLQAAYRCPACGRPTERPIDDCGTVAELVRGNRLIDNDVVNVAATLVGAVVGAGAALIG